MAIDLALEVKFTFTQHFIVNFGAIHGPFLPFEAYMLRTPDLEK